MLRFRSNSTPVHFASSPADILRWMGYWVMSRTANVARSVERRWHTHFRPALAERRNALAVQARTALERPEPSPAKPYSSLAAAVREAQRGSRSGISATT